MLHFIKNKCLCAEFCEAFWLLHKVFNFVCHWVGLQGETWTVINRQNSQRKQIIIAEVQRGALHSYFILLLLWVLVLLKHCRHAGVFTCGKTELFLCRHFGFLGTIYDCELQVKLWEHYYDVYNLHLLLFSFPSLCACLPLISLVSQSVSQSFSCLVDVLREPSAARSNCRHLELSAKDWEALRGWESSTPVFCCWSWQRASSVMSGGVHTVGPESQTANSDKSQPND